MLSPFQIKWEQMVMDVSQAFQVGLKQWSVLVMSWNVRNSCMTLNSFQSNPKFKAKEASRF